MGGHQSRARSGKRSGSDDEAVRCGTAAAFRAIDARNINKLRKALSVGAAISNARQSSSSDSGSGATTQVTSRSMSLLEYAVDKNYLPWRRHDAQGPLSFILFTHCMRVCNGSVQ